MKLLEEISQKVQKGDLNGVQLLVEQALKSNIEALDILNSGLIKGMAVVGQKFKNNEIFIPEVLIAANAMKGGMQILKPYLTETNLTKKGKVLIGTVKGDLHDIGKNLVCMMLEGAGFEVIDLGINVPKEKFIEYAAKENPDVLGMSALLTTTMVYMPEVIEGLKQSGLRDDIKVIVGGAPVTEEYARNIGSDGYAPDAGSAVELVKNLLQVE